MSNELYLLMFAFIDKLLPDPYARIPASQSFWNHGVGRTCVTLEVRKSATEPTPVPAR